MPIDGVPPPPPPLPPPPPPPPLPPPQPAFAANATTANRAIAVVQFREFPRNQINSVPMHRMQTSVTSVVTAGHFTRRGQDCKPAALTVQSGLPAAQGIESVPPPVT